MIYIGNIEILTAKSAIYLGNVGLEAPGSGHLSLGSVAESCGFADQAHFSRRFKALHGMTPSEYRATLIVQTQ